MLTSVAAMIGAMVESAPTDIKRLAPKAANAREPAAKANTPLIGGMPASRAVASCSGIAIAASVIAAIASPGSQEALKPCSDGNSQPTRLDELAMAPAGFASCRLLMPLNLLLHRISMVFAANVRDVNVRWRQL